MAVAVGTRYVFDEFSLEPEKRLLTREGTPVPLANRPFQVLVYLIENRDRVVARSELLENFWDGREVYDEALTKCVGTIRKALHEDLEHPRFIETRWAEGYRFIGSVEERSTGFPSALVGVEKTRELKIVVEDYGAIESEAAPLPVNSSVRHRTLAGAGFSFASRRAIAATASALCLIAATATAVFFFSRRASNAIANPTPKSIAVLPLKNLSNRPDSDYFSDGMTENLISALSKIEGLKVISRNSVFAFKLKDADPAEVGKRLGVATVLEGSVNEDGDRIRVEARLVNTANGQIIWASDNYDRAVGDVLAIQDDIARSVATHLRLKLTQADEQHLARRPTNNPAANQAYVKGMYFRNKKTKEALPKALEFFQEAIKLDPKYALAYAGLASYYTAGIWYANLPPTESTAAMKAAALKALELDPQLSEAHLVRGRVAEMEWDWETERKELERAIELDPNNAQAYYAYAFYLSPDYPEEALTAIKRTQELDPISPSVNVDVGVMLTRAGRYEEAIATLQKAIEFDPNYDDVYYNLARAYERKGMYAETAANYIKAWGLMGDSQDRLEVYRGIYSREGPKGLWRKHLEFMQQDATRMYVSPVQIAEWQARLGETEAVFRNLEKSYAAHDPHMLELGEDFAFDSLRGDPRFRDLLRRVGLKS